jgi:YD repeat-containing protein
MQRILFIITLLVSARAAGAETITYSYDEQGRLTQAAHSGGVNNGQVATYSYDSADNRVSVTVTGASH